MRRYVRIVAVLGLVVGLLGLGGCRAVPPAHAPAPLAPIRAVPDPAGGRFVDARGREVVLRGVNVNALVEYWAYSEVPTVFPFTREDARMIAAQGWNVVRLAISWSRVEPAPGVYDEQYLDAVQHAVRLLAREGVYSLVDLHQDAWGPTLAAPPGQVCAPGSFPAFGWDGAPGWATLDGGATRCTLGGTRETSGAVFAAFAAFWADAPAADGVGIRTRYAAMLGRVAARFAKEPAVVGYDLMNEPNVYTSDQLAGYSQLAADALSAIRAAESASGGFAHILFVEPSIVWPTIPLLAPDFVRDDQVAFAPHLYNGGLTSGPIPEADFARARADAGMYGHAPILVGEWGSGPDRAADPADTYFDTHQDLQDRYRFSSTLWTWRESCGDPHKAGDVRDGRVPYVWGFFEVDCTTNTVTGPRTALADATHRGYVRAAPGALTTMEYDADARILTASGAGDRRAVALEAFVPRPPHALVLRGTGLTALRAVPAPGGSSVRAWSTGGPWTLEVGPSGA